MVRMTELNRRCLAYNCHNMATVEVFDVFNVSHGKYCQAHGEQVFQQLRERELQDPAVEVTGVEAAGDGV